MDDGWLWFDFENTPHVLFLEPLLRRMADRGRRIRITAKPQSQTLELADARGLEVTRVGSGGHKGLVQKVWGGVGRSVGLVAWVIKDRRPQLLVSSSRTASLAALVLGIPAIGLLDYEHSEHRAIALACRSLWCPDLLRNAKLPAASKRIARYYAGLKENLYLDSWPVNREAERIAIGVGSADYLVVARPPAETAHYGSEVSGRLFYAAVAGLLQRPEVHMMIVPRTADQRRQVLQAVGGARAHVLDHAVAGPSLVAASDLVLSGGGTMNREAAVLGVPAWSVFAGPTPYIDETLAAEGRLRWVRTDVELTAALAAPPPERMGARGPFPDGIAAILGDIEGCLRT